MLVLLAVLWGCGGSDGEIRHDRPADDAAAYPTAYIAAVVAAVDGDDLAVDGGEHVVVASNFDQRTDMGGWALEDADGTRLPLGIGRQLDPGGELRIHTGCGTETDDAVFACLDTEVLDDGGDTVRLLDAAGAEVDAFRYGE